MGYKLKKGFTLVELSIVLVIIGLLIGGILVAQSLIDSVKTNKLVRDMSSYKVMAQLFKSQYKYLPGDSAIGFPQRVGIRRDGKLILEYERNGFWNDLYLADMVETAYDGAYNIGYDPVKGISMPELDYLSHPNSHSGSTQGKVGLMTGYPPRGGWGGNNGIYNQQKNYLSVIGTQRGYGALTAEQALAVDKKADDYKPGTGEYVTVVSLNRRLHDCTKNGTALAEAEPSVSNRHSPEEVEWRLGTSAHNCSVLLWLDD